MLKETLEEVAESKYGTDMDSIRGGPVYDLNADSKRAFVKGAKWQQERMYSEEDLRNAYRWGTTVNHGTKEHFNNWFEQFKKNKQ
jgi:hypothetical protein